MGQRLFLFLALTLLLLSACTSQSQEEAQTPTETAEEPTAIIIETPDSIPAPETPTPIPLATAERIPTLTPSPIPTSTPVPVPINGISVQDFVVLSADVRNHMRQVFLLGREMGRNPNAYSILGDSTALNPQMMARFDADNLNLGQYNYLQSAVDQFTGYFSQYGVSARHGLHSWSIFDPIWADKKWCFPNETLLECEFRLRSPSILIIRLGSNDSGSPDGFRFNIRKAIEFSLENGVMPVVATKADRFEGPDNVNNTILRELAETYKVPLWDFDIVAETLPERGLDTDGIHMVEYLPNDYAEAAAFESGHAVQDLTGLMMLYMLWQDIIYPNTPPETAKALPPAPPSDIPILVNGIPTDSFIVLPQSVKRAMTIVFYEGQAVGRIPAHFSKIGDSLVATPSSLTLYDSGPYDLSDYAYLQSAIDYFAGSFARYGVGVKPGMRSWSVFDPEWSSPEWCDLEEGEGPLACEIRLHNPAVIVVVIGSNDSSEAEIFIENMHHLVEYATTNGVIPILLTKADRYEGGDNRNNTILRDIAAEYNVPLVDFDIVAETLPNRGLGEDNIHLESTVEGNFNLPQGLQTGYGTHNLVILMGLYKVWQEIIEPALVVDVGNTLSGVNGFDSS